MTRDELEDYLRDSIVPKLEQFYFFDGGSRARDVLQEMIGTSEVKASKLLSAREEIRIG